jgi:GNAT superfamily N-acetyltransferase
VILELQPAGPEHVDAFASVYRASAEVRYPTLPQLHSAATLHGWSTTMISEHEAWVGVLGSQAVACLVLGAEWIHHLHVHPDSTGIGVGTRLIELAQYRRNQGLQMRVDVEAAGARRFLERHGFVPTDERTDDASGLVAVTYAWRPRP